MDSLLLRGICGALVLMASSSGADLCYDELSPQADPSELVKFLDKYESEINRLLKSGDIKRTSFRDASVSRATFKSTRYFVSAVIRAVNFPSRLFRGYVSSSGVFDVLLTAQADERPSYDTMFFFDPRTGKQVKFMDGIVRLSDGRQLEASGATDDESYGFDEGELRWIREEKPTVREIRDELTGASPAVERPTPVTGRRPSRR